MYMYSYFTGSKTLISDYEAIIRKGEKSAHTASIGEI